MISRERWNRLVEGAAYLLDDPLSHAACAGDLCVLPEGHHGLCDTVPAMSACGELAFHWGLGPCPECPRLPDA